MSVLLFINHFFSLAKGVGPLNRFNPDLYSIMFIFFKRALLFTYFIVGLTVIPVYRFEVGIPKMLRYRKYCDTNYTN